MATPISKMFDDFDDLDLKEREPEVVRDDSDRDEDDDDMMIQENTYPLIEVDGFILKKSDHLLLVSFVLFQYVCHTQCGLESSPLSRDGGQELDPRDEFCRNLAIQAIEKYNHHHKKPKLKFEQLVMVKRFNKAELIESVHAYNLTLLASNEENGRIGTYRAMMLQHHGEYFLGLLVDHDSQQVLAIISVTGARSREIMLNFGKAFAYETGSKRE